MRVGIIGCGTAGAAAAIALARAGCQVDVLERVAEPGPVGAGIMLQPTGQAVLARLGLLDEVAARGAPIDRLFLRTRGGRTLADLRYTAIEPTWRAFGIHRGVLFEALHRAASTEPHVAVRTGCDVRSLRRDGAHTYAIAAAADHGPFDLVVIADGAQSALRGHVMPRARDTAYPWGALWFVTEDRERAFSGELYQVAHGARRLYGALPTGLGPRGDAPIVSLFWSLAARDHDAWRAGGLDAWKRDVLAMDPRIAPVLDAITAPEQVTFARYRDVRVPRVHDDRVVLVGDAAHATSPQLGQGANLALLDALALADCVAATPDDVPGALAAFARVRRRHVGYYQRMARWLTPLFQHHSRVLGWMRDVTFPIANAIPPLRRHMVRTMAGVALGFSPRRLELPSRVG
ncbi:MAG TPA: NAD(P)/FAD-dependent oxidoreductase [Kofleriaceae bacterium]|nr:NAD(P)/FAD-dependent oxidoreductase [Kofleriaceae bacterium]